MSDVLNTANDELNVMADESYEAPTLVEVGDASENILGTGVSILDADNETKLG